MFDNYVVGKTSFVPYDKNITINRAPTDESIILYDEIKEKAYNSILDTIEIKNNILNISAILYHDFYSFDYICKFRMILNSKDISGKFNFEYPINKQEVYKKLIDQASKHIAFEMCKYLIENGSGIAEF